MVALLLISNQISHTIAKNPLKLLSMLKSKDMTNQLE